MKEGRYDMFLDESRGIILWYLFPFIILSAILLFFGVPERLILFLERGVLHDYPLFIFSPEEALMLKLKLAFVGGAILSLPFAFFKLYFFPNLKKHRRMLLFVILPFFFLFICGIIFGYYVLIPPMMSFFAGETLTMARLQVNLEGSINLVVFTLLVFGISFEFPLMVSILAKLHIVNHETLLRYWRHAMVLIVMWAGFITPDVSPISQAVVALPMVFLFFVGVILAKIFY